MKVGWEKKIIPTINCPHFMFLEAAPDDKTILFSAVGKWLASDNHFICHLSFIWYLFVAIKEAFVSINKSSHF